MTTHIQQEGFAGQIEIGGNRSPVTYMLNARQEASGSYRVAISLTAPRDWLLEHGFRDKAILLRKSGAETPIHSEGVVDVADNAAVTLHGDEASIASAEELRRQFPELRTS